MVIPIKIQKILMYIPFTNFLIMIFWLINYVEMKDRKTTVFMKSLLIMFAGGIPISIVFMILSRNFADNEILVRVFNTASSYLSSFFIAFGLVKYQEKVFVLKKTKALPENRDNL